RVIFFFAIRRRHTRSKRDWSSDVCSSDLVNISPQNVSFYWVLSSVPEKRAKKDPPSAGLFPSVCLSVRGSARLAGEVDLRHQLLADDGQHLLQLVALLGAKALFDALHDLSNVVGADIAVIPVFLGHLQVIFPLILLRLHLGQVPLAHQTVDLIGRIGG